MAIGGVEPGSLLGKVGRWEGHGDAAVGPLVAGVAECGPEPVTGLEDGGAAEPDHGDRREAPADVDLDPDRVGGEADQGGRGEPGQHRHSTPFRCSTRGSPRRGQTTVTTSKRTRTGRCGVARR
jgi:hypothetical protein